ncbi:MAG: 1-hydroxycarotenoid 3,4-desaturase CrtD [Pseudomonadota bacterium]
MNVSATMRNRVVVIGAGMGGLAAAIRLALAGYDVHVVEKEALPGGKMRTVRTGSSNVNAGPTVFTMKWVFDRLLDGSDAKLEDIVPIAKMQTLARHFWTDGASLDLFADVEEAAAAIGEFSDRQNRDGFLRFVTDSEGIFRSLKETFIAAQRPGPIEFTQRMGLSSFPQMLAMKPFTTMWKSLGQYFPDRRLQQLFGRYATYCGSSPFASPATLQLVAHVEQAGVWSVRGGMAGLAKSLADFAAGLGVQFRYGARVTQIETSANRVTSIVMEDDTVLPADSVIFNGDVSAVAGLLGTNMGGPKPVPTIKRSLSAMTFCIEAEPQDFQLAHHTVFFSDAYKREFDEIFSHRRVPQSPTTYICAQDRADDGTLLTNGKERLLCLINAPADGDTHTFSEQEIAQCRKSMTSLLAQCGMTLTEDNLHQVTTTPTDFAALFPSSGGALYGRASHGWMASFQRAGAKTALENFYLAGGSVHPGPGVPMAALSGMLAAESLVKDRVSTQLFQPVAISGGTSTA